jgi:hypothetical protein
MVAAQTDEIAVDQHPGDFQDSLDQKKVFSDNDDYYNDNDEAAGTGVAGVNRPKIEFTSFGAFWTSLIRRIASIFTKRFCLSLLVRFVSSFPTLRFGY